MPDFPFPLSILPCQAFHRRMFDVGLYARHAAERCFGLEPTLDHNVKLGFPAESRPSEPRMQGTPLDEDRSS